MPDNLFQIGENPRYWTLEQRREKFSDWKARQLASDPSNPFDLAVWHPVDDPMTSEQFDVFPDAPEDAGGCSALLWVKFRHRRLGTVVVSKGRYEPFSGLWHARQSPEDRSGRVTAIAWAHIVDGEIPWTGTIICEDEEDVEAE
jgi:hypothetical protein